MGIRHESLRRLKVRQLLEGRRNQTKSELLPQRNMPRASRFYGISVPVWSKTKFRKPWEVRMDGIVQIGTKSKCEDFPTGVIAGQSEMSGMTGGSEACVIVSIRYDGLYSVKCYRYGEFGILGDGGDSIWYRVGSSTRVKSAIDLIKSIEMWAGEIDAYVEWENLIFSLHEAYPKHAEKIRDLAKKIETWD